MKIVLKSNFQFKKQHFHFFLKKRKKIQKIQIFLGKKFNFKILQKLFYVSSEVFKNSFGKFWINNFQKTQRHYPQLKILDCISLNAPKFAFFSKKMRNFDFSF